MKKSEENVPKRGQGYLRKVKKAHTNDFPVDDTEVALKVEVKVVLERQEKVDENGFPFKVQLIPFKDLSDLQKVVNILSWLVPKDAIKPISNKECFIRKEHIQVN